MRLVSTQGVQEGRDGRKEERCWAAGRGISGGSNPHGTRRRSGCSAPSPGERQHEKILQQFLCNRTGTRRTGAQHLQEGKISQGNRSRSRGVWAGQEGAQPSTKLGASQGQTLQPLVLLAGECHSMLTQGGFSGSSSWWRCRPRALCNAAPGKLEFHSIAVKYCEYFSGRWGQRGRAGQGDLSVPAPPACLLSRGV